MPTDGTRVRKHSVVVAGHRTSVSMEDAFWEALSALAEAEGRSINDLVTEIDRERDGSLSSAIKVHVLRNAAPPRA
ncbi:MAG: ribbon-helix-helix domain-containing protein [Magnetovibrio sp.]|nr:ribbon-helix-helix domain-containing protein [Magnetovibrio sp.]